MTVSRIEKNKNIDVVINAFCKSEDLNDRLFVVGNGPDLNKIASQTKDERVIFTGFIANDELQKIYKICECFIVSYYKLEAGPLTAIEAMAAGKVIISSKTGAMTERLTDKFAFWHHNDEAHLFQKLREVKKLKIESVKEISERHIKLRNFPFVPNSQSQLQHIEKYKKSHVDNDNTGDHITISKLSFHIFPD